MKYEHHCVIDANGYYKTLVLVAIEVEENGEAVKTIFYYTLKDGESLINAKAPGDAFVKPRRNGDGWEETGTPEEIATAEAARMEALP